MALGVISLGGSGSPSSPESSSSTGSSTGILTVIGVLLAALVVVAIAWKLGTRLYEARKKSYQPPFTQRNEPTHSEKEVDNKLKEEVEEVEDLTKQAVEEQEKILWSQLRSFLLVLMNKK